MARYTDSVCRLCRREMTKLYLKGSKCYSPKCPVSKRTYPPGQHGQGGARQRQMKVTEYGMQLREKQKLRRIYGILEGQFRLYFGEASRLTGVTGENLLRLLETRLDNTVYRLGLSRSRAEARMLVTQRHMTVNGKIVNIPSCQVKSGDVVAVKEASRNKVPFQASVNEAAGRATPPWLSVNLSEMSGSVLEYPTRDQIDTDVREQLVVEYYSR